MSTDSSPARTILVVDLLLHDRSGRFLTVRHVKSAGWHLPGSAVGEGESIAEAALRCLKELTGLSRQVSDVVLIDQVPAGDAKERAAHLIVVVHAGTVLPSETNVAVSNPPEGWVLTWLHRYELGDYTLACEQQRIERALSAAERGMRAPLYLHGVPVPAPH
ncbi:NUDIX domain-containing protein [Streptomyces longispororuber]|uniref:NUDIX domain-containing protein n=1 Tax=Streptomyces longispororuber TaxID=68230 RepID=UPI0036FC1DF7